MPDLFLSYSRDDSLVMGLLRDNLRKLGFTLWIDIEHLRPGTPEWVRDVKAALRRVDGMLVLCSPSAESSEWVNREISIAKLAGKPIFPVLIQGDPLDALPAELIGAQYCDMRGRADAEQGFRELVAALAQCYGLNPPDFRFESGGAAGLPLPVIQIINVTGHVEGSVIALSGDVAVQGDFVAGDQHIGGATSASQRPGLAPLPPTPAIELDPVLAVLPGPFEWVDIPGGEVSLISIKGWPENYIPEGAGRTFRIQPFRLARFCVTNAQFDRFIQQGYRESRWWSYSLVSDNWSNDHPDPYAATINEPPDHPRVKVSWFEAVAFCRWLSDQLGFEVRLPTEQEWQCAAQGSDGRPYAWGNDYPIPTLANWNQQVGKTSPVYAYPMQAERQPYGLANMTGNVWEWTLTDFRSGSSDVSVEAEERVLRGGSWWDKVPNMLHTTMRFRLGPGRSEDIIGFRLACDAR